MFTLSPTHLLIILIVFLLIFGPSRLPEVGRALGQTLREFRKAAEAPSPESLTSLKQKLTESGEPPLLVFISSIIGELLDARAVVKQALDPLPYANGWLFEEAPASSDLLVPSYLEKVEACDMYVLLLGRNISEPVRKEYDLARSCNKPCLVFVQDLAAGERSPEADAFFKSIPTRWKAWQTPDDLFKAVQVAVTDELVHDYRRYHLTPQQALGLIAFLQGRGYKDLPKFELSKPEAEPSIRRVAIAHEMILIQVGDFIMGREDGNKDEKPVTHLYLASYRIGKYPVTNAQFEEFVRWTGYKTEAERAGSSYTWQHPHGKGSDLQGKQDHPVVYVTWHDALEYARVAGKRLPTEAEWEKAASWDGANQKQRRYPWGDEFDQARCNTEGSKIGGTTPVWKYPRGASPCEAMDMAGNVWEWCSSLDRPYPYRHDDGRENLKAQGTRVLRGGSWSYNQDNARCAYRYGDDLIVRCNCVGFRIAESALL